MKTDDQGDGFGGLVVVVAPLALGSEESRTGTGPTTRKAMTALGKEGKVVEQTGKHPRSQVGDWGR